MEEYMCVCALGNEWEMRDFCESMMCVLMLGSKGVCEEGNVCVCVCVCVGYEDECSCVFVHVGELVVKRLVYVCILWYGKIIKGEFLVWRWEWKEGGAVVCVFCIERKRSVYVCV